MSNHGPVGWSSMPGDLTCWVPGKAPSQTPDLTSCPGNNTALDSTQTRFISACYPGNSFHYPPPPVTGSDITSALLGENASPNGGGAPAHPAARCRAAEGWTPTFHVPREDSPWRRLQRGGWALRPRLPLFPRVLASRGAACRDSTTRVLHPLPAATAPRPRCSENRELGRSHGDQLLLPHPERQLPVTC